MPEIHNEAPPDVSDPQEVAALMSDAHDRSGADTTIVVSVMPVQDGERTRYMPRIAVFSDNRNVVTADWVRAALESAAQRIRLAPEPDSVKR